MNDGWNLKDFYVGRIVWIIEDSGIKEVCIEKVLYYGNDPADKNNLGNTVIVGFFGEGYKTLSQLEGKILFIKPADKERFWLWSIKQPDGTWIKCPEYINDLGEGTNGIQGISDWKERQKMKHENEFIEV